MTDKPASAVADWLMGVVEGRGTRVDLAEWRAGAPGARVRTWKIVAAANLDVDRLAEQMRASAENDGAAQPGARVTYVLIAFGEGGDTIDRCFVPVPGANAKATTPAVAGDGNDVRDMAGVLNNLMRTLNDQSSLMIRSFQHRDDAWKTQLESVSARLEAEQKRYTEVQELHQKHVLLVHEREQQRAENERQEKRDSFVMEQLATLIPIAANRMLGGGPGKGAPGADMMLAKLFESFSREQVDAILASSMFDDKQKAFLIELFLSFAHRAEQKRVINPDPETNGVGGSGAS